MVESLLVGSAYAHCGRNQVGAARLLGISRNVLRTLLKRHRLISASAVVLRTQQLLLHNAQPAERRRM